MLALSIFGVNILVFILIKYTKARPPHTCYCEFALNPFQAYTDFSILLRLFIDGNNDEEGQENNKGLLRVSGARSREAVPKLVDCPGDATALHYGISMEWVIVAFPSNSVVAAVFGTRYRGSPVLFRSGPVRYNEQPTIAGHSEHRKSKTQSISYFSVCDEPGADRKSRLKAID